MTIVKLVNRGFDVEVFVGKNGCRVLPAEGGHKVDRSFRVGERAILDVMYQGENTTIEPIVLSITEKSVRFEHGKRVSLTKFIRDNMDL